MIKAPVLKGKQKQHLYNLGKNTTILPNRENDKQNPKTLQSTPITSPYELKKALHQSLRNELCSKQQFLKGIVNPNVSKTNVVLQNVFVFWAFPKTTIGLISGMPDNGMVHILLHLEISLVLCPIYQNL